MSILKSNLESGTCWLAYNVDGLMEKQTCYSSMHSVSHYIFMHCYYERIRG